jgi:hypothetical protein
VASLLDTFVGLGLSGDTQLNGMLSGLAAGINSFVQIKDAANNAQRAIAVAGAAMSIWSSNARNRSAEDAALSGAAQGAATGASMGGGYGAIIGAIVGAWIAVASGSEWRAACRNAASVLGVEVSDALVDAIQRTEQQIGVGGAGAALLHLSEAMAENPGRSASGFAPQMLGLLEGVRSGWLPAAQGLDALGDAFARFSAEVETSGELASQGFVDVLRSARALGQEVPGMKEWTAKWLGQAAGAMTGITGTIDGGRVVGGLGTATEEQATASATIFSATFWALVQEQGILKATEAMRPAFDALQKQIEDAFGPEMAARLLGGAGRLFAFADDPQVVAALGAVDALKAVMEGLANAGYMTQGVFDAFAVSSKTAFDQLIAGGMTSQEAYEAMAPELARIIEAHQRYGFVIDETTQKMIDEARAAGVAFPVDPIYLMVDAVHELINAIRIANGLPPLDWGTAPPAGAPGGGGTTPTPRPRGPGGGDQGFALGGIARGPSSGYWALLHGTELVTPLGRDGGGEGGPGGGGHGGGGGGYIPPGGTGTIPPGPWGGGQTTQTTASIAAEVAAHIASQTPPVVIQSSTPITIQESSFGREGREEFRAEAVRGIKDALWAHDQDLEDLIRRVPGRGN